MALTFGAGGISGWDAYYYAGGTTTTGGTKSFGNSGYVTLEGGFILQWGNAITTNTTGRYSNVQYFPISFPSACISVVMCEGGSGGWGYGPGAGYDSGAGTMYSPTLIGNGGFYFEGCWVTPLTNYYSSYIGSAYYAVGY
jgi:hypothetical protein